MPPRGPLGGRTAHDTALVASVALLYYLAARLGLQFVIRPEGIAVLWPAAGILLGFLLIVRRSLWPPLIAAVMAALTLANLGGGNSLRLSLGFAFANALESVLAASVVIRILGRRPTFHTIRDVIVYCLAASIGSTAVTAFVGAAVVQLSTGGPYWSVWQVWWTEDCVGMLVVGPVILEAHRLITRAERRLPRTRLEVGGLAAMLLLSCLLVFATGPQFAFAHLANPYVLLPIVYYAAFRFGVPGAVVGSLVIAIGGVLSVASHGGPFQSVAPGIRDAVLSVQGFLAVITMTSLGVASIQAERQAATDALRESESALKRSQEVAHVGHWTWTTTTNRVSWSDEMRRIFGVDAAEYAGDLDEIIRRTIHPDDIDQVKASNEAVNRDGQSRAMRYRVVRPDGVVRHVWATPGDRVTDDHGQVVQLSGTVQDITELKQAEAALAGSEARLEGLLEVSRRTFGSSGELLEFALEQAITLTGSESGWLAHYREDRGDLALDAWFGPGAAEADAVAERVVFPIERAGAWGDAARYRRPVVVNEPGTPDPLLGAGVPGGVPVRRVLAVPVIRDGRAVAVVGVANKPTDYGDGDIRQLTLLLDAAWKITERRLAEERYLDLFEHMIDGFALHEIVLDDRGAPCNYRFLAVNPAFERLTGLNACDVVGKTALEVMPGTEAFLIEKYGRVAQSGEATTFEFVSGELGRVFTVAAFRPAPGQFATVFADVTDQRQMAAEKRELESRLRQAQKMEAIGTLAGGIAHDFNDILTPISAYAELAQMAVEPGTAIHQDLAELRAATERAKGLVRQILAISRKEDEGPRVRVNLASLVGEAARFLRASLPSTIDLDVDVVPSVGAVWGDPSQIHQVLLNLCTNAADAVGLHAGALAVSLAPAAAADAPFGPPKASDASLWARLSVEDTGPGIPESVVHRIFDPYFTTKPRGKGTGLGLAITRSIVDSLGGEIRVCSRPGRGTRFDVYLPVAVPDGAPAPIPSEPIVMGSGQNVLIVDDETPVRTVLRKTVESLGYRATVCATPAEALRLFAPAAAPAEVDIVLTDQTMPEMTGLELAAELLRLRPGLPVILATGFAEGVDQETVRARGLREIVAKPYTRESLGSALARAASPPRG